MNSNQARSRILQKLHTRHNQDGQQNPKGYSPVRLSSVSEFSENISKNGALITFSTNNKTALQAAKQLCEDNEWSQPAVVSPALLQHCRKLQLWSVENNDARPAGTVAITQAFCGISDTGTLLCLSSAANPTSLNFLPEHHIVLLDKKRIVERKQDAWAMLRNESIAPPRAINLISGPSRTADIEQTIQLGAHGPRSLTVIIVG